jgi:hypothetical protein
VAVGFVCGYQLAQLGLTAVAREAVVYGGTADHGFVEGAVLDVLPNSGADVVGSAAVGDFVLAKALAAGPKKLAVRAVPQAPLQAYPHERPIAILPLAGSTPPRRVAQDIVPLSAGLPTLEAAAAVVGRVGKVELAEQPAVG